MKNSVNRALAAKKQYTSPRTDVVSVQITTSLLAGSGNLPIGGGDKQINAW